MITLIKIENITKKYGSRSNETEILKGITLSFEETGFVSILGKSGSGKTTLLNILGGLDKGNGKLQYEDVLLEKYDAKTIDLYRSKNIGYIFQNYLLLPDLTVYENLDVALSLSGINNAEERNRRIETCLKVVKLDRYKRRVCSALSGGQQQRVAIARALAKDSKVLICDEPTGKLDTVNAKEIMQILKGVSKNKLVIMVTHNEKLAKTYSSRIIRLVDGEIISDKKNNSITKEEETNAIDVNTLVSKKIVNGNIEVETFSDDKVGEPTKITIYQYDGKIRICYDHSLGLIEDDISFSNENVEEIVSEDINIEFSNDYDNTVIKKSLWQRVKESLGRVFSIKGGKKTLYIMFFVFGLIISSFIYVTTNLNSLYVSEDQDKKESNSFFSNQITLVLDPEAKEISNTISRQEMVEILNDPNSGIVSVNPYSTFSNIFSYHSIIGDKGSNKDQFDKELEVQVIDESLFKSDLNKVILGERMSQENHVMVTSAYMEAFLEKYRVNNPTVSNDVLIGSTFSFGYDSPDYFVTGVVQSDVRAIVCSENNYFEFVSDYLSGDLIDIFSQMLKNTKLYLKEDYLKEYDLDELNILYGPKGNEPIWYLPNVYLSKPLYTETYIDYLNLKRINMLKVIDSDDRILVFEEEKDLANLLKICLDEVSSNYFDMYDTCLNFNNIKKIDMDKVTFVGNKNANNLDVNDVIVSKKLYEYLKVNNRNITICDIAGFYDEGQYTFFDFYCSSRMLELLTTSNVAVITNNLDFFITEDFAKTQKYFNKKGYLVEKTNDYYLDSNFLLIRRVFVLVIIVIALVVSLFVFLMNRSKMIKNIYTIGVFRSLGVAKKKIYRVFLVDSITTATITMGGGYLVGLVLISYFANMFKLPYYNPFLFLIGLAAILVVNVVSALLPLASLLKKTPREITIKYDI